MSPLVEFATTHSGHLISSSKQSRSLHIILIVLLAATIIFIAVTYMLQRRRRAIDKSDDLPEKLMTKPPLERHDSAMCQNQPESNHNNYLNSLKEEILHQTEKPIYPWILPPQALPGPYDPMYYPLPAPSLRHKPAGSPSEGMEGRHSTSYTRLVPNSGVPQSGAVLYGTMTTSTNGWRRSHWNVTGG
ncbi:hypothetical protein OPT61_g7490 [Boeremia exigua]|uniref:Uncharacterized protein n=1 Tax=Boeremia exigua TaxID=749465 RepID=A0ACC2I315_9PLEO|nr:hypothetical protein OPT61_g7490 [Boeremia exigua]